MNRFLLLSLCAALLSGCGNKIDLPRETKTGSIPFKNYFVYAEWGGFGDVTDILITRAQWVFLAEDSATVKRYKRKGSNVDGTIVPKEIRRLEGFERPVKLDEGTDDHLWVLDLTADYPATTPVVRYYDLFQDRLVSSWSDTIWSAIDTTWQPAGWDSANIFTHIRVVDLTSIAADRSDNVYVSGKSLAYRVHGVIQYDTVFAENPTYPGEIDHLDSTGFEVTYEDTLLQWFVRAYDSFGEFQYEAVGLGTGLGFGDEIHDIAIAGDLLVFIDGAKNQVKANDPTSSYDGIGAITGEEADDAGEIVPFLLDPGGLAGDPSGFIYVADTGSSRIVKYDSALRYEGRVDQNDPGIAAVPTVVGVTDSLVYVFDEAASKVVLFEFPKAEE